MRSETQVILRRILRDIQVELKDEFDKNFERQAFFSESWQRRSSPTRSGGHILVQTGGLRRSIQSRVTDSSIMFFSTLPYASIHNDGGEIVVTERMKRYFWHKHMTAEGVLVWARRKDGSLRRDKKTRAIKEDAEFWKWMALKKAGTKIRIPRRRFLGASPEVEKAVREIIEENLNEYIEDTIKNSFRKNKN